MDVADQKSPLPLLLFDGNCGFCLAWIHYWKQFTQNRVAYYPYQEFENLPANLTPADCAAAVQLVLPDGTVRRGAHAVFTLLAIFPGKRWLLWAFEKIPLFAAIANAAYSAIAEHRSQAYRITKFLWGIPPQQQTYEKSISLFLRVLGAIYFIAFLSFGVQAAGLIGSHGILPVCDTLHAIRPEFGLNSYRIFPTVLWLGCSDRMLSVVWIGGLVLSALLVFGVKNRTVIAGLFILYLSLVTAGQIFMGYQWDALLLESGLLAIFLGWSDSIRWLFRWLLFRLMFMSGAVKLLSGDPTWRDLTALDYHFETQPLPTPLAWYFHQMPAGFHRFSTAATLFIELVVPFLLFLPRKARLTGAFLITAFQVLIFLTGNYNFFNLLAIALCILAISDQDLANVLPRGLVKITGSVKHKTGIFRSKVAVMIAGVLFLLSVNSIFERLLGIRLPIVSEIEVLTEPFQIVNSYGLFAVMTTSRPEIVIEGSNDGQTWLEYSFKYKAGDVMRRPSWVEPHQPRLDWQMWFAALDDLRNNPWFIHFVWQLLQGSPEVLNLMNNSPFPTPPHYIRAILYEYHFTSWSEHRRTGAWWTRTPKGVYMPAVDLSNFQVSK